MHYLDFDCLIGKTVKAVYTGSLELYHAHDGTWNYDSEAHAEILVEDANGVSEVLILCGTELGMWLHDGTGYRRTAV